MSLLEEFTKLTTEYDNSMLEIFKNIIDNAIKESEKNNMDAVSTFIFVNTKIKYAYTQLALATGIITKEENYNNVFTYDFIPRREYEQLTRSCDIGLIFLDKRFTIPNYPSKTLSYLECSLPIMAAIDKNTDYSNLLTDENCGFWVENGDLEGFVKYFDRLVDDKELRMKMGKNGRKYFEKECDVEKSVKILERYVEECKNV